MLMGFDTRSLTALLFAGVLAGGNAFGADGPKQDTPPADPVEPTVVESHVVSYPEYRDPLIRVNRVIFNFNDVTYRYVLIPLSTGYIRAVPEPVRNGIGNFFHNVKTPIYVVNHLLQGRPRPLGRNLLRFGINTTVGLLGLFDPARAWFGLEREAAHFEDTMADYGAEYGIYIVLPFLGSSDLRNGMSMIVDYYLNPIPHAVDRPASSAILGFDYFQEFAPEAERYRTLRREAEDPYIFFRNLYLQGIQRDAEFEQ